MQETKKPKPLSGIEWLERNCDVYCVERQSSGILKVSGVISRHSKQGGYVERFLPKVFRSNKKPPYLIHKGSTYKAYRAVEFCYTSGESLDDFVRKFISAYCPGDKKVETQPYEASEAADYGNQKLWVVPAEQYEIDLDSFSKLETVNHPLLHLAIEGL